MIAEVLHSTLSQEIGINPMSLLAIAVIGLAWYIIHRRNGGGPGSGGEGLWTRISRRGKPRVAKIYGN